MSKANKLSSTFIRISKQLLTKKKNLWQETAGTFFKTCEHKPPEKIKVFLDDADTKVLKWIETLEEDQANKVRRTWKTSYLGIFRACQKARSQGLLDNLSVFLVDDKPLSVHKCRELLGTGTKPKTKAKTPETPETPPTTGNKDAVNPPSNPPRIKVPTVKNVEGLYDALLPAFEMARNTILTFSKSKAKVTNSQGKALTALSESLNSALNALADLIE